MKVAELIEKLQKMPQDAYVYFYEKGEYPEEVDSVSVDKDGDVALNINE